MTRAEKQNLLEQLKLEREFIRRGGYQTSVRTPRRPPTHLRDSITCLNVDKREHEELEPCDRCFWMDFVPPEGRDKEMPCRNIPLNERGDTVNSLDQHGDREETERQLLDWLSTTIARLEQELAQP